MGGFLPGVKQIANVAALPGIVGHSVGLPDIHSGYGFAIGKASLQFLHLTSLLCQRDAITGVFSPRTILTRFSLMIFLFPNKTGIV